MTDSVPNATPRPLPEPATTREGRPWPAPSPNADWWLGDPVPTERAPAPSRPRHAFVAPQDPGTGGGPPATSARHAAPERAGDTAGPSRAGATSATSGADSPADDIAVRPALTATLGSGATGGMPELGRVPGFGPDQAPRPAELPEPVISKPAPTSQPRPTTSTAQSAQPARATTQPGPTTSTTQPATAPTAEGPRATPVKADPVKADPVKADPVKADPVKAAGGPDPAGARPSTGRAAKPAVPDAQPAATGPKPGAPGAIPTATPAARPTAPAAKPTTPAAKPTTPAAKPTTPAARPTTPATRPTTPAAKPSAKPAARAAKPPAQAGPVGSTAIRAAGRPGAAPPARTPRGSTAVTTREDGFPLWPDNDEPDVAIEGKPVVAGNEAWPTPQMRPGRRPAGAGQGPARPPRRPLKGSRPPALGLGTLLLLALLSGFFGWVSADPFWLALGHAEKGTATVTRCTGKGIGARCVGTFQAAHISRDRVALSALPNDAKRPGATVPARMVSAGGRIAYAGRPAALHIRWVLGTVLVLLCGVGIAWATGAGRLARRKARMAAYATSMAAPLLLLAGLLIAAW